MKCNDCGEQFEKQTHSIRADVCDPCWETRGKLVSGDLVPLGSPDMLRIQRAMGAGRGTVKRCIERILAGKAKE